MLRNHKQAPFGKRISKQADNLRTIRIAMLNVKKPYDKSDKLGSTLEKYRRHKKGQTSPRRSGTRGFLRASALSGQVWGLRYVLKHKAENGQARQKANCSQSLPSSVRHLLILLGGS